MGEGWIEISASADRWFDHDIILAAGDANAVRRGSIEAHELGHLFFDCFEERASSDVLDHTNRSPRAERFCWQFALALFCPPEERADWNADSIHHLLVAKERAMIEQLPENTRAFTFYHLRALARMHGISIRLVIAALDRHRLLDELGIGVVVIRNMPNPATRLEVGMRIWQRACPSWGYLIRNQRAAKQGFRSVDDAYRTLSPQRTAVFQEQLRLSFRNPTAGRRWFSREIKTMCAYTAVDVVREGRYVVAIWHWPQY
jgi:hypothetical protein